MNTAQNKKISPQINTDYLMTADEVSQALNIPRSTVAAIEKRALKKLRARQALSEYLDFVRER